MANHVDPQGLEGLLEQAGIGKDSPLAQTMRNANEAAAYSPPAAKGSDESEPKPKKKRRGGVLGHGAPTPPDTSLVGF